MNQHKLEKTISILQVIIKVGLIFGAVVFAVLAVLKHNYWLLLVTLFLVVYVAWGGFAKAMRKRLNSD